jgi:hypothetical protein
MNPKNLIHPNGFTSGAAISEYYATNVTKDSRMENFRSYGFLLVG